MENQGAADVIVIKSKTYEDGLAEGKQTGKEQGYRSGVEYGRNECSIKEQNERAEEERQAAIEARRLFWDTAYNEDPKLDPKAQANKADSNLNNFMKDVQAMNMKEFLSTEKELNELYDSKKAEWKKNHKWWQVLDPEPQSPMIVKREASGAITSIEFPGKGHKIPVTYWNSETEAAKLQTLADAVRRAEKNGPIERSLAQKSLQEELAKLKIPQISQLETRRLMKQ